MEMIDIIPYMCMKKELRNRFISDLKLPIPVVESPYFEFYLDLYEEEWGSRTDFTRLTKACEKNPRFLEDYYSVRDKMIQHIKSHPGFESLNTGIIPGAPKFQEARTGSIYNMGFSGGKYLSLDLRKANFQALRYWDPTMFPESPTVDGAWGDWVNSMCGENEDLSWYMKKSKYLRQVIFGNCNPKRQIKLERWMIGEGAWKFLELAGIPEDSVVFASTDEVIVRDPGIPLDLKALEEIVMKETRIELKAELFTLESVAYLTGTGETLRVFKKIYPGGRIEYKGVNRNYFAQVYMDQKGINPDPEDKDLVFYQDKDLVKYIKRICRS